MYQNNNSDNLNVSVFITNASGEGVASKIQGYFVVNNMRFRFSAIAFGRIGGHNVSLKIANNSLLKIKKMNIDTDNLQLIIQRKLIEGDVVLQEKTKKM